MHIGSLNTKNIQMEEKEKNEDISLSVSLTEDEKHILIFEESTDSLVTRMSFYDVNLSKLEKIQIGNSMLSGIADVLFNRDEERKSRSWRTRCEAFKEAFMYEDKENKTSICWLMTSILGLSQETAESRFDVFQNLKSLKGFQELKEDLVDKVYLNDSHLKDSELGDVELVG